MAHAKRCVGCGAVVWVLRKAEDGAWVHGEPRICCYCGEKVVDEE